MKTTLRRYFYNLLLFSLTLVSCQDFLEVYPRSTVVGANAFKSDETAEAVGISLYSTLNASGFSNGSSSGIAFLTGLSSDELINYSSTGVTQAYQQFNSNMLTPHNIFIPGLWEQPYKLIYQANVLLQGIEDNKAVSAGLKDILTGEARFMRAFSHFYLVNLFGDIPLVLTTNYQVNSSLSKSPATDVYSQIITDLKFAQSLLPTDYEFAGGTRIRVNKWAATAFLARVYLYTGDWVDAEAQASAVIDQQELYRLPDDLNTVFLKDSEEAIWQLARYSGNTQVNAYEGRIFTVLEQPSLAALSGDLFGAFEPGDKRAADWVGRAESDEHTYYYASKYKSLTDLPVTEYSMVLRLGEQYLVRAEARARQGKLIEAAADLNAIRSRAGLSMVADEETLATKEALLLAIEQERRLELFTEWGHRWFDLKRTNRADAVLSPIKPHWTPTAVLYPIPENQLLNNPGMTDGQNEGYH